MIESTIVVALISALVTVLAAVPATLIAIRKLPLERRQTEAETTSIIAAAARGLIEDYKCEVDRLSARVATYEEAVLALQERDRDMQRQIKELEKQLRLYKGRNKELEAQIRALKQENEELRAFYEKANNNND